MARAGEMMIRVRFASEDRLTRVLENITGKARQAGHALAETNRTLGRQTGELRDVQRNLKTAGADIVALTERERALEGAISRTNRQFDRQKRFAAIDARTKRIGEIGEGMVSSGKSQLMDTALLAAPLIAAAHAGAEFEALQNRMRVLGLGDRAVKELTDYARAMDVAGSSATENMRFLLEAQGAFRESGEHSLAEQLSGAKLMAPLLAKMHAVADATGKAMADDEERYFLRFVEQAGGLASPKRAAELTDGLFRALQSSGGNVQASDYQSFMARAGIAGSHLSNRAMFADFEPLIGELHEQAGVGLSTAFKQATGIKVNSRAAAEFLKLGLWDRSKITFNQMGGVKTTNGNPLKTRAAELLQHDPVEFYRQIVMPAYDRAGIKTGESRAFENAKLFGGTGGNLFNLIDKQLPTILRSRQAFNKTQTLDQAYQQTTDSFFGKEGKLKAAGKDFMVAAGTKGGLLDQVTNLMTGATKALRAFTAWGNAHPTAFSWIGTIATDLLLVRGGLAVAKIAFGGLLGPVAEVWGLWSKIRVAGGIAAAFPAASRLANLGTGALAMAGGFRTSAAASLRFLRAMTLLTASGLAQGAVTAFAAIRTAAIFLAQGVMRAGLLMLANPMVLAIVAIGTAIGVASYLVYTHWDRIRAAFLTGWRWLSGFVSMFKNLGSMMLEGLLSMLNPARLAQHLWNMGKTAVSAFKGVLGIHSPSRVFAGIGGHLMEGLDRGIADGAGTPLQRVLRLARQLAAAGTPALALGAVAPALASPAADRVTAPMRIAEAALAKGAERSTVRAVTPGAGATGAARAPAPASITIGDIHVHAAPGQDAAAIGQEVRRQLELLMREKEAAARSRYNDYPDWQDR